MTRLVSRAESWEVVYNAFNQINFTAFDYNSIKQSIVDYLKLYFPESFNDFIESSELIAIIEVFAYLGELLIYRVDVSSHENFMSVAQRKQNVLRLAKLVSYKTTRNLPARGLLKITSLTTTQELYDSRGNSLKGKLVSWNDINNVQWKEQFITILNASSVTNIGTVQPSDRVQVDNVLFELYSLNNRYPSRGVLPYNISVDGNSYEMEIVPARVDTYGPAERRPEYESNFTYLYGTDGFGNESPTTGFFLLTKQGSLTSLRKTFDGKTPNQYIDLPDTNINDTDLWINQINGDTQEIVDDGSVRHARSGEWHEVDTTTAQNVIFSYTSGRNRFETETLENDQVRIAFGDGEYANIPSGTFDIWYRKSLNEDLSIPQNSVVDKEFTISYIDKTGQNQTLRFTVSLISNLQNASASEDIEHIRRVAPPSYYTQNRMVNAADYNLYPLKDPSILKLRTINRTYVGESKFSHWHDSSNTYENVKLTGDDLAVLVEDYKEVVRIHEAYNVEKLFNDNILPILLSPGFYNYRYFKQMLIIRKFFNTTESAQIKTLLTNNVWPDPLWITYNPQTDVFFATTTEPNDFVIRIDATMNGGQIIGWITSNVATKLIVQSPTTKFWSANGNVTVPYDTIVPQRDSITILRANIDKYGRRVLDDDIKLAVASVVIDANDGLQDVTKLEVISRDEADWRLTGGSFLQDVIDPRYTAVPISPEGLRTPNPAWNPVNLTPLDIPAPPKPTIIPPLVSLPNITEDQDPLVIQHINPMVGFRRGTSLSGNVVYLNTSEPVDDITIAGGQSDFPNGLNIVRVETYPNAVGTNFTIQGTPTESGRFRGYFVGNTTQGDFASLEYDIQVNDEYQLGPGQYYPTITGPNSASVGSNIVINITKANPVWGVQVTHWINNAPSSQTYEIDDNGNLDLNYLLSTPGLHKFDVRFIANTTPITPGQAYIAPVVGQPFIAPIIGQSYIPPTTYAAQIGLPQYPNGLPPYSAVVGQGSASYPNGLPPYQPAVAEVGQYNFPNGLPPFQYGSPPVGNEYYPNGLPPYVAYSPQVGYPNYPQGLAPYINVDYPLGLPPYQPVVYEQGVVNYPNGLPPYQPAVWAIGNINFPDGLPPYVPASPAVGDPSFPNGLPIYVAGSTPIGNISYPNGLPAYVPERQASPGQPYIASHPGQPYIASHPGQPYIAPTYMDVEDVITGNSTLIKTHRIIVS